MLHVSQRVGNRTRFCCVFAICRVEVGFGLRGGRDFVVTLRTCSCNFHHVLDATLWTCSCNFQHALGATFWTWSCNFHHALDAMPSFFHVYCKSPEWKRERPIFFSKIRFYVSIWNDWQAHQNNHHLFFTPPSGPLQSWLLFVSTVNAHGGLRSRPRCSRAGDRVARFPCARCILKWGIPTNYIKLYSVDVRWIWCFLGFGWVISWSAGTSNIHMCGPAGHDSWCMDIALRLYYLDFEMIGVPTFQARYSNNIIQMHITIL